MLYLTFLVPVGYIQGNELGLTFLSKEGPGMPLYEYHCPTCNNKFDKLQSMSASAADCPNCEQPAKRIISVFAAVSGKESVDTGFSPLPPMGGGGCCGGGCGCGH